MLAAPGMGMLIEEEEIPEEFDGNNQYDDYQKEQMAQSDENKDKVLSPGESLISTSPDMQV